MQSLYEVATASQSPPLTDAEAAQRKANRVRWLKLNFTVKAARLQTLKRHKYQHLQEEALLKARGLLENWENGVVVLTEDLYRLAAGEREAAELMNYTPEALALRFSLRNNPCVLEAVRQLWQIEMPRDSLGCISQRAYTSVFRRIAKSLDTKAFRKKHKTDRLLDEDWKRDSKGEPTMGFANFFDSIFELADLWCETIDAVDYVNFLERLRNCISHVRGGKRALKVIKKVAAIDAESDEEDEEEEEPDSTTDGGGNRKQPPSPAVAAPRLLIAKSICPTPQQQHQPQENDTMRKVSRLVTTSKTGQRKESLSSQKMIPIPLPAVTATIPIFGEAVQVPVDSSPSPVPSTVIVSSLVHHPSSLLGGLETRQRRASVFTTIQLFDEGFMGSVSEGLNGGSEARQAASHPSAKIVHAAAVAFASAQHRNSRPSLASTAVSVLARRDESSTRPSTAELATTQPHLAHQPQAVPEQHPVERDKVITMSTVEHAVLKSVVLATRRVGKDSNASSQAEQVAADQLEQPLSTTSVVSAELSGASSDRRTNKVKQQLPQGRVLNESRVGGSFATTDTPGAPNSFAVRIQRRSLFGRDYAGMPLHSSPSSLKGGTRQGFTPATASKRGRGGLAPLASQVAHGGQVNPNGFHAQLSAHAMTPTKITQSTTRMSMVSIHSGIGGIDFSDSVVMTNYVVDRPPDNHIKHPLRPVTVLGPPPGSCKKPPLSMIPQSSTLNDGGLNCTRVLAQHTSAPGVAVAARKDCIPSMKDPIIVAVSESKDLVQLEPSLPEHQHRNIGHALQAAHQLHQKKSPPVSLNGAPQDPEGDLEHALRIKAALDAEHATVKSKDHPHGHATQEYEHNVEYAATSDASRTTEHGLMKVQSLVGQNEPLVPMKSAVPARSMDPVGATPWDAFNDDDGDSHSGGAGSTHNLLQPENATEALAKVLARRTVLQSAGSSWSRGSHGPAPPSASTDRRQDRPGDSYADLDVGPFNDEDEDTNMPKPGRTRLLTVASLGNERGRKSVVSRQATRMVCNWDSDEGNGRIRESVSAPTLQLVLDYASNVSLPKPQTRTSNTRSSMSAIKLPPRRVEGDPSSFDDLHLRGEVPMDASRSPMRSPAAAILRCSPIKICPCPGLHDRDPLDESSSEAICWPSPVFRLDRSSGEDDHSNPSPVNAVDKCAVCKRSQESTEATIIVNAKHELFFEPKAREQDVLNQASRAIPSRSEMMRRRHRHSHGKV